MNIVKYKHFGINATEQDLIDFKKLKTKHQKDDFIKQYAARFTNYNVLTECDVLSLLLGISIACRDHATIDEILSQDHGNILTCTDGTHYSPLSSALYSGDEKIFESIKKYITKYKPTKTDCDPEDQPNILTVLKFPQKENLTTKECIDTYLEPLYTNASIFVDFLNSQTDY